MRPPWILYVSVATEVLAPLAALVGRRRLSAARKWVVVWCAFLFLANLLALVLSLQHKNNHWMTYVMTPIASAIALWVLAFWQTSALARLWVRLLIPMLGVVWIGIVLLLEDMKSFSLLAEPFVGLLVLGAATYTLVSRSVRELGSLLRHDWLWIGTGMAFYSAGMVALPTMSHWVVAEHPELVAKAYQAKSVLQILAFLAIAVGMLCPILGSKYSGSASMASARSHTSLSTPSKPAPS